MNSVSFPIASILSAALAFALSLVAMPVCRALGLLDRPDARKQHRDETPLMGGLVLLGAALPLSLIWLFFAPDRSSGLILGWLAASAAMTIVGLADDRHTLSARDRLLASFLIFGTAAIIFPSFYIRLLDFEHPYFSVGMGTDGVGFVFTLVCCVGLVNAINMADGKNGLVIGLCLGWLALLALRAPPDFLPFIEILAAACVALLIFNLRGRLFLGDGGAYGLACAIGLLAIVTYNTPGNHAGRALAADEIMLLFSVPVIDSFRLTFARLRQGRSPMSADRDHLHHHLMNKFGWPGGLLIYWVIALLPSAIVFTAY